MISEKKWSEKEFKKVFFENYRIKYLTEFDLCIDIV